MLASVPGTELASPCEGRRDGYPRLARAVRGAVASNAAVYQRQPVRKRYLEARFSTVRRVGAAPCCVVSTRRRCVESRKNITGVLSQISGDFGEVRLRRVFPVRSSRRQEGRDNHVVFACPRQQPIPVKSCGSSRSEEAQGAPTKAVWPLNVAWR